MRWLQGVEPSQVINLYALQAGIHDLELAGAAGTDTFAENQALWILRMLREYHEVLQHLHQAALLEESLDEAGKNE